MTGTGKQRMDIHYARLHHRLEPPAALPCHADRAARPSRRVCSLQRLGPPPTRSERDEQHLVLAEAARLARSMPWAGITWASGCSAGSSGCSPTLTVPVYRAGAPHRPVGADGGVEFRRLARSRSQNRRDIDSVSTARTTAQEMSAITRYIW